MNAFLVEDNKDKDRAAIVLAPSHAQAMRLMEEHRLSARILTKIELVQYMRLGYPVIEAKEDDKGPSDEGA